MIRKDEVEKLEASIKQIANEIKAERDALNVKAEFDYPADDTGAKDPIANFAYIGMDDEFIEKVYKQGIFDKFLGSKVEKSYSRYNNDVIILKSVKSLEASSSVSPVVKLTFSGFFERDLTTDYYRLHPEEKIVPRIVVFEASKGASATSVAFSFDTSFIQREDTIALQRVLGLVWYLYNAFSKLAAAPRDEKNRRDYLITKKEREEKERLEKEAKRKLSKEAEAAKLAAMSDNEKAAYYAEKKAKAEKAKAAKLAREAEAKARAEEARAALLAAMSEEQRAAFLAKEEAERLAREEAEANEKFAKYKTKLQGDIDAIINTNADDFYEALGYLVATTNWVHATVPIGENAKNTLAWFDKLFPGHYCDTKDTKKAEGSKWYNLYGMLLELKIDGKAIANAPKFLTVDLAGTAKPIFGIKNEDSGCLNPKTGIIANKGLIERLVNEFGFDFSPASVRNGGIVPKIDEVIAKVNPDKADIVRLGYLNGINALEGAASESDDVTDDDIENAFDLDFDDIAAEDSADEFIDEAYDEEKLTDDPFTVEYESNTTKVADKDTSEEDVTELEEGISDNLLAKAADLAEKIKAKNV